MLTVGFVTGERRNMQKKKACSGAGQGRFSIRKVTLWFVISVFSSQYPLRSSDSLVQHIPFPDNHFDFVYATEATVYAPSLQAVYTETARVLKPGGVFGVYEWLMTDDFDPKNPKHVEIRQRIERGDGVVNMLSVKEGLEAFRGSGCVTHSPPFFFQWLLLALVFS